MSVAPLVFCSVLLACCSTRPVPAQLDVAAAPPLASPPVVSPPVAATPRDADAEAVEAGCEAAAKRMPAAQTALDEARAVIAGFDRRRIHRAASARENAAAARCHLVAADAADALDEAVLDHLYEAETLAPGSVPFERALAHIWLSGDDFAHVIDILRPWHTSHDASPSEAAALAASALDGEDSVRTLAMREGRDGAWYVVHVRGADTVVSSLFAVGCPAQAACVASRLIDVQTSEGAPATIFQAHVDAIELVAIDGHEGLRVALGLDAWNEIPDREGWEDAVQGHWYGAMLAVRWLDGPGLAGWNVLTRADQTHLVEDLVSDVPPDQEVDVTWSSAGVSLSGKGAATSLVAALGKGVVSHTRLAREAGGATGWLGHVAPARPD